MEGSAEFLRRLEAALALRTSWLDGQASLLKDAVRTYQQRYQGLWELFLRKGLIREDPYDYGHAAGDVGAPSDDPFLETERYDQVSRRLDALRRHLDTVGSSWKLDAGGLDLGKLKRLSGLVRYLPWANLTEQSQSPTARAVAQFAASIRKGTDRVTAVVVRDAVNQLAQSQRELAILVAAFAGFRRELWKAELRARALPRVPLDRARTETKREDQLRALRRAVAETMPGSPFYPELAGEVLDEETSPRAEELRASLLESLARTEEAAVAAPPRREPPRPDRNALIDAVRLLARSEAEMQSALATLTVNADRLAGPTRGLAGLLHRLMEAVAGRRGKERTVDVEYLEQDGTRHETVALVPFLEAVRRKVELLASLGDESGQALARLSATPDEPLLEFVERQLSDLLVMHRRMGGVNARLQAETISGHYHGAHRGEAKGIRLELSAVKNFLIKASQRLHDYTARLEELRQYEQSLPRPGAGGGPPA